MHLIMGLLVEAQKFFSRHIIVAVVEEPDNSYKARKSLPGEIEAEISSYERQIALGGSANPD